MTTTTRTACRSPQTTGSERRRACRFALIATTALTPLWLPLGAFAEGLPSGGQVVQGAAAIAQPSASQMNVNQSSQRAVINWDGFSVGQGNAVTFNQPNSNSAVLNRVTGGVGSRIDGSISANGHVYLINPRGVVVGPTGRVDAQGFVASSLNTDDDDFMQGRLRFEGAGASAGVENHGTITVGQGGFAALLGGKVTNTGTIVAPLGRIGLGAGEQATLDLTGDGFLQIAVPSDGDGETLIEQAGRVSADGGLVEIRAATARDAARRVVNLSGVTEARSVSGRNGRIVLGGGNGGTVNVTGRVSTAPRASALIVDTSPRPAPRPGGDITITGDRIEIASGADIRADAPGGGGAIRIGGDLQGSGPLQRATTLSFDDGAVVSASATEVGDGGYVILWSDTETNAFGRIRATGGPEGGDGGFIEVSSPRTLRFAADVSAAAGPGGAAGTLLLDPTNILVCTAGPGCVGTDPGVETTAEVEGLLNGGTSVTLDTSGDDLNGNDLALGLDPGDILIDADVTWVTDAVLSLTADNDIDIDAAITANGDGDFFASADRFIDVGVGGSIAINGTGEASLVATSDINTSGPLTMGGTGTIRLESGNNILIGGPITGASGTLEVEASGEITTTPSVDPLQDGNVDVGVFDIAGGAWVQNNAVNPDFNATDFRMSSGTTFLRAFDGDGSVGDPYEIRDVFGLQGMNSPGTSGLPGDPVLLTANWILGNDIDASGTSSWNDFGFGPDGFRPIGDNADFTGTLDATNPLGGNDFEISGLFVERSDRAGLFAFTDGATISNLRMPGTNVRVFDSEGLVQAGGLVASATDTVIQNVAVGGNVGSAGGFFSDSQIGGVVGNHTGGSLDNVTFDGAVDILSFSNTFVTAGGVVALLDGDLSGGVIDVAAGTGAIAGGPASSVNVRGIAEQVTIGGAIGELNVTGDASAQATVDTALGTLLDESGGPFSAVTVGGVVGIVGSVDTGLTIDQSTADVDLNVIDLVSGSFVTIGGLVGENNDTIVVSPLNAIDIDIDTAGDVDLVTAGGIAGLNASSGTIAATGVEHATGEIDVTFQDNAFVGGVAGENLGAINSTDANMNLTTTSQAGAFGGTYNTEIGGSVGRNSRDITDSLTGGTITASGEGEMAIGGVVGNNSFGFAPTVADSHAGGLGAQTINVGTSGDRVLADFGVVDVGGFAGVNNGSIINGISDADVSVFTQNIDPLAEGASLTVVGGFVATDGSQVLDSIANGTVTVDALGNRSSVGGFVGSHAITGVMSRNRATGDVIVTSNLGANVGGFVGITNASEGGSSISDSRADGGSVAFRQDPTPPLQAVLQDAYVGGFAGSTDAFTSITRAATTANVVSDTGTIGTVIGGFTGDSLGDLTDVYARGDVSATGSNSDAVGGLIGQAVFGEIENAVSTGTPSGAGGPFIGAAIGELASAGVNEVYFDSDTAPGLPANSATGLPTTTLQDTALFQSIAAFDFSGTWAPGAPGIYPQLFTIDPVILALPDAQTVAYNDPPPTFTGATFGGPDLYVFDDPGNTVDTSAVFSVLTAPGTDVGIYDLTAPPTSIPSSFGPAFQVIYGVSTYTVTPAPLEITTLDQNKSFGDATFALDETEGTGWEVTSGTLVPGDIDSVTLESLGEDPAAPVGTYAIDAIEALGIGATNYDITFVELGELIVDELTVILAVTLDQQKVYGEPGFALDETEDVGWSIVGGGTFRPGDGITSIELDSAGEAVTAGVGTYAIATGDITGTGLGNYDIQIDEIGELTVNPLAIDLTITTLDQSKTYGASFALDETEGTGWVRSGGGLINGDTLDAVSLASAGVAPTAGVGDYEIAASNPTGTGIENYVINFANDGNLTVNPLAIDLTITTLDQSKTYGASFALDETEGTGWIQSGGGLINGDTLQAVTLESAGEPGNANVGTYDINVSEAVGPGMQNYILNFANDGDLTVDPAPLELTTLDQTKVFGDAAFALDETEGIGWEVTSGDVFFDDRVTSLTLDSPGEAPDADVGTFEIVPGGIFGDGLDNYDITVVPNGSLTIDPRSLSIALATLDQTKVYGDAGFSLAETEGDGWVVVDGVFAGDDGIDVLPLSSAGEDVRADAGFYGIVQDGAPIGTGLSNYEITVDTAGLLTVTRREIDVTISTLDQTKVYGTPGFALNEEQGIGWVLSGSGEFLFDDGITGVLLDSEGEAQTASVGPFAIATAVQGVGLDNYAFGVTDTGILAVTPAPLTITPDDQVKQQGRTFVFDGTEFSTSGLRNDDEVTLVDLFSEGADAGARADESPFAIEASNPVGRGLGNYDVAFGAASMQVTESEEPELERPIVVFPPRAPNLPNPGDTITNPDGTIFAAIDAGSIFAPEAAGSASSPEVAEADSDSAAAPAASGTTAAQSIEVAESVLTVIERASSELDATVDACRETDQAVTDFLGCVSDALESFSATLDPATLDLPQELASVSAAVVVARRGVDAARTRATARLAGVTDPAQRRQIELDAVAEARGALQAAEAEVTKAITLIRADDPELANVYRAQANTVVAALNSVEVDLQRAVGL